MRRDVFKERQLLANEIDRILQLHVPNPIVPLFYVNSFTLLIAVLLSAQCTDERVNSVTGALFKRASTPNEMVKIPFDEVVSYIKPCGLYRVKAKNILALSQILIEKHEGEVPRTLEELEALPGVGHKTASVVLVQAFDTPAFPVDTHILRSAVRWGLSTGKKVEQIEKDLKRLYPKEIWGRIHLQIVLFARRFCPARGHLSSNCPVCSYLQEQVIL
ncbi:MAG: endonuclease III [Chlamydia sp.]